MATYAAILINSSVLRSNRDWCRCSASQPSLRFLRASRSTSARKSWYPTRKPLILVTLSFSACFSLSVGISKPPCSLYGPPLHVADPVGSHRRVMEQGRALRGRVLLGKPFEGVEQHVV